MRCDARYRSLRKLVFGAGLVSMGVVACAQGQATEHAPPKLVWERTFERDIVAVGVDEDCYVRGNADITGCLKWILFKYSGLGQLERGKVKMRPEGDRVYPFSISANGKYLCAMRYTKEWWSKKRGVRYNFLDWEGRSIWRVHDKEWLPMLWDDGSGAFLLTHISSDVFHLQGVKFFNRRGRIKTVHEFPNWPKYTDYFYAKSSNFLALATIDFREGYSVTLYVFKKSGELLWKKEDIRKSYIDDRGRKGSVIFKGVSVSDRGEVILLRKRFEPTDLEVLIYDHAGVLKDSQQLSPTGHLCAPKTVGRFAFVPTGYYYLEGRRVGSRLLCYDLEGKKVKFLLEEKTDHRFGSFDVDAEAGLVAVAVLAKDRDDVVKIYDMNGAYRTEVNVDIVDRGSDEFWLKLLDNALLVAEGDKLRLYEIDVE